MDKNQYRAITIQVDDESLGDVPFEVFEPLFSAELKKWFPETEIDIECGLGTSVAYSDGMEPNYELVHECSEAAFVKSIDKLNAANA